MFKHTSTIAPTILAVIVLLCVVMVGAALYYQFAAKESNSDSLSYVACGCGCCSDMEQIVYCLYYSRGDDINDVANQDALVAANPDCAYMGCSVPIIYTYCDSPSSTTNDSANTSPVN